MAGVNQVAKRGVGTEASISGRHPGPSPSMRGFADPIESDGISNTATAIIASTLQNDYPARNFDMASELLDRASVAFDLLINRYQRLERDLEEATRRAETQAAEQNEAIEQWKRLASGLKAQLDTADQTMVALKRKCEAAETRAVAAERKISESERASALAASHAATAEQQSTKLHDKIVAAFGIGSRAHPVLEAVAIQAVE